jgi:hypothetical protein
MIQRLKSQPYAMMSIGLAMGLLVGIGMVVGTLVGTSYSRMARFEFPETILNATATHGGTTMAIATGPIDDGIEGLFVLDFITGQLQASVLNPRTGAIGGLFKVNVVGDLGVEQGKQPKYLLATGKATFRSGGGNVRPAESIVYVADENTGRFAAYYLPWNRQASQYNFAQASPMILLGKGSARNIELE